MFPLPPTPPTTPPSGAAAASAAASAADIEIALYSANRRCFGSEWRSPKLGGRHIDKGVYVDQIARWYASFRPDQFHVIRIEEFTRQPERVFRELLAFLDYRFRPSGENRQGVGIQGTAHTTDAGIPQPGIALPPLPHAIDFSKRRLEKPNRRMPVNITAALSAEVKALLQEHYNKYDALLNCILPSSLQPAPASTQ
jgi:hypothetical protein